jgi:hypothetical protein
MFRLKVLREVCSKMGFDLNNYVKLDLEFDHDDVVIGALADPIRIALQKRIRNPYSPEELREARVLSRFLESCDSNRLDNLRDAEPRQIISAFHIAKLESDSPKTRHMTIAALASNMMLSRFVVTTNWDDFLGCARSRLA